MGEIINRPGDVYQYKVENDHWLAKKPGQSRWYEISGSDYKPQFQSSLDILDRGNPNARSAKAPNRRETGGSELKNQVDMKITSNMAPPAIIPSNLTSSITTSVKSGPVGTYGDLKEISGKPLVVVFGGIPVSGRQSGGNRGYMYDFLNKGGIDYTLFVSKNHKVDGAGAYQSIKDQLAKDGIKVTKKVLYLFSGGYYPGQPLLEKFGAKEFDKIYLVDIWMGNSAVSNFYKKLANDSGSKIEYYYTSYGSNNESAAKYIASKAKVSVLNTQLKGQINTHMATNVDAVKSLNEYI